MEKSENQPASIPLFAICTFDLKNGTPEDYATAYAELDKLQLFRRIQNSRNELPFGTTAGMFTAAGPVVLRDDLYLKVKTAFDAKGFASGIFISTGDCFCWTIDGNSNP